MGEQEQTYGKKYAIVRRNSSIQNLHLSVCSKYPLLPLLTMCMWCEYWIYVTHEATIQNFQIYIHINYVIISSPSFPVSVRICRLCRLEAVLCLRHSVPRTVPATRTIVTGILPQVGISSISSAGQTWPPSLGYIAGCRVICILTGGWSQIMNAWML